MEKAESGGIAAGAAGGSQWVFGYGSLIWNPGFVFLSQQKATLRGAHRSLAIYSHHYRGTVEHPGLVFGLAQGGSCRGMGFEIAAQAWPQVLAYLRERELVTGVYREARRPLRLDDGRMVSATTYMVSPTHEQYAGRLSLDEQIRLVRDGVGTSGSNIDYVLNTARHLSSLGIRDRLLAELVAALEA